MPSFFDWHKKGKKGGRMEEREKNTQRSCGRVPGDDSNTATATQVCSHHLQPASQHHSQHLLQPSLGCTKSLQPLMQQQPGAPLFFFLLLLLLFFPLLLFPPFPFPLLTLATLPFAQKSRAAKPFLIFLLFYYRVTCPLNERSKQKSQGPPK